MIRYLTATGFRFGYRADRGCGLPAGRAVVLMPHLGQEAEEAVDPVQGKRLPRVM